MWLVSLLPQKIFPPLFLRLYIYNYLVFSFVLSCEHYTDLIVGGKLLG